MQGYTNSVTKYEATLFERRTLSRAGFKRHRSHDLTGEFTRVVNGLEAVVLKAGGKWYAEMWRWKQGGDEYIESVNAPNVSVLLDIVNKKQGKGGKR